MTAAPKAALVVFARHPRRARVKTRLVPPLTHDQALSFHEACLQVVVRQVASFSPGVDKFLCLTSAHRATARRVARRLHVPRTVSVRIQGGGDLGARLARLFAQLQREGFERVVVIGTDSPALPRRRLLQAFAALRRSRAVLGPAYDGGYYLVGLRLPVMRLPALFRDIDWGTRRAYWQTRSRLRAVRLTPWILVREHDVDTADDLERLRRSVRRQPHLRPLRRWFRSQRT